MTYFNQNKAYLKEELYYTIFRIGRRVILSPCDELKYAQKHFKNALNWVYPLKMDISKSAKIHCGKKWVLKLDIQDFYGSVPYGYIEQVVKNTCKRIKNADVNYYLMITTLNYKLPTGAPTSAHIANACFSLVDRRIREYCRALCVDYSRYMDDMTFSADNKFLLNMVEEFVQKTLTDFGYKLNVQKSKYISGNKQQNVLGLVVNNKTTRLPKDFRRKLRAMIHSYSVYYSQSYKIDLKYRAWNEHSVAQLKGYLAYAKHVDKETYNKLIKYAKTLNLNL